ncbi:hypothetical protein [Streptomyces sp. NBC_01285]|uniref:hypothetical protein n=1 Tax=Streptomyces sp. NBC_01285 TaxID=2903813 RepID=UPI00225B3D25|nr:hypothetical protein [Streptomyces sp. NBC_01285]MCX4773023.1 hypothetical protein [Streptomyces sp. NBC_01285]
MRGADIPGEFVQVWRLPEPEPVPGIAPEILDQLEERVRALPRGGYGSVAELAESAEDCLVKDGVHPVGPAQARLLVERLWPAQAAGGLRARTSPGPVGRGNPVRTGNPAVRTGGPIHGRPR